MTCLCSKLDLSTLSCTFCLKTINMENDMESRVIEGLTRRITKLVLKDSLPQEKPRKRPCNMLLTTEMQPYYHHKLGKPVKQKSMNNLFTP